MCGLFVKVFRELGFNWTISTELITRSGQISIIPKPEFFGDFGEVPLLNHNLG